MSSNLQAFIWVAVVCFEVPVELFSGSQSRVQSLQHLKSPAKIAKSSPKEQQMSTSSYEHFKQWWRYWPMDLVRQTVTAILNGSSGCKVSFTNDLLGPKVTWAMMLLDFASRFPELPEWQVAQTLHRHVCLFRSRFQQLTVLKGVQVTGFKHATSLKDFHLGWPSGFCGCFNPSSPLRVWFSLIKFSLEICCGTPKHLISLDFDSLRRCPLSP